MVSIAAVVDFLKHCGAGRWIRPIADLPNTPGPANRPLVAATMEVGSWLVIHGSPDHIGDIWSPSLGCRKRMPVYSSRVMSTPRLWLERAVSADQTPELVAPRTGPGQGLDFLRLSTTLCWIVHGHKPLAGLRLAGLLDHPPNSSSTSNGSVSECKSRSALPLLFPSRASQTSRLLERWPGPICSCSCSPPDPWTEVYTTF